MKLLLIAAPILSFALFVLVRALVGRPLSRFVLNVTVALFLLVYVLVTAALALAAVWSLIATSGPIDSAWLSVKLLLFAAIIGLGIAIRLVLPRLGHRVAVILKEGSTPEREAALDGPARQAQWLVLGIWTSIVIITWITVAKP